MRLCYLIAGYHLTNTPSQDGYTTNYSPDEPNSHRKSPRLDCPWELCKHHSNDKCPALAAAQQWLPVGLGHCSALTLIMLQQPVSPRIPHLHRVVHAGSSNAGTTGVEVHIGDKTGETEQSYTIRRLPWVEWTQSALSLCVCSHSSLNLEHAALPGSQERANSR